MRHRLLAFAALLLLAAAPLFAAEAASGYKRGDVFLEEQVNAPAIGLTTPRYQLWVHVGAPYAFGTGFLLLYKFIPFSGGAGRFLVPAPDRFVFHDLHTVSWWDGKLRYFGDPGKGYNDIFTDDAELAEIAPMRSGHFLVAERGTDRSRPAKVIEFDLNGPVAEYALPEHVGPTADHVTGAQFIELLADQCTLLYTIGNDDPTANDRVRRYDICTRQAKSDFATLQPGRFAGSIRQLPNGDVLVANGDAVLQFDARGGLLRSYPFEGVELIALTTDGSGFWAASPDAGKSEWRHFDVGGVGSTLLPIGTPAMGSSDVTLDVNDLVVIGEWRAAAPPAVRLRAVR